MKFICHFIESSLGTAKAPQILVDFDPDPRALTKGSSLTWLRLFPNPSKSRGSVVVSRSPRAEGRASYIELKRDDGATEMMKIEPFGEMESK